MPKAPVWVNNPGNTLSFYNRIDYEFPQGIPISMINYVPSVALGGDSFIEFLVATGGANNGQMVATQYSLPTASGMKGLYWYYPRVVNTVLKDEFLTNQQANTTTQYRLRLGASTTNLREGRIVPSSTFTPYIYSGDTSGFGGTATLVTPNATIINNRVLNSSEVFTNQSFATLNYPRGLNIFQFGVHAQGGYVGFWYELKDFTQPLQQSNLIQMGFIFAGWLYKSAFDNASSLENESKYLRYRRLGLVQGYWNFLGGIFNLITPPDGTAYVGGFGFQDTPLRNVVAYPPAEELGYNPNQQNFLLHEIRVLDSRFGTVLAGCVDNRMAILGRAARGFFEPLKVYLFRDIFDRTGDEYWICLNSLQGLTIGNGAFPQTIYRDDNYNITNESNSTNAVPLGSDNFIDYLFVRINFNPSVP